MHKQMKGSGLEGDKRHFSPDDEISRVISTFNVCMYVYHTLMTFIGTSYSNFKIFPLCMYVCVFVHMS